MTRERFAEILEEYGYNDAQITFLWNTRPSDNLDEEKLRKTATEIAPRKNILVQV